MKQVVAIVKPFLAPRVIESLHLAPLEAISVREVKGYGRQKSYLDEYGDSEYSLAFLPKVEITLWVDDVRVEEIIRQIVSVARTGRMGDGKIFVLPVAENTTAIDIASGKVAHSSGSVQSAEKGAKPSSTKASPAKRSDAHPPTPKNR